MRAAHIIITIFLTFGIVYGLLGALAQAMRVQQEKDYGSMREIAAAIGGTDLALSTEARYTRHPAVSDMAVVTMDHPGAVDHFPSTLFWAPLR